MTKHEPMNVTGTGIAVALAVIIALAFLFFGSAIFVPFTPQASESANTDPLMLGDETGSALTTANDGKLMVMDTTVGTGVEAVPGKTVTVNYVGKLENGTIFDASANHGQPFSFALGAGQVIQGWEQGIAGMKVGGKRTLTIPPELGYGPQAVGSIPANSTLIFEVELLDVK